jgi:hypothetical protein
MTGMASAVRTFDTERKTLICSNARNFLRKGIYVQIETYIAFGFMLRKLGGGAKRACCRSSSGRGSRELRSNRHSGCGNSSGGITGHSRWKSNTAGRHDDPVCRHHDNASEHAARNNNNAWYYTVGNAFTDADNSGSDWARNHPDEPRNSGHVADKFIHYTAGRIEGHDNSELEWNARFPLQHGARFGERICGQFNDSVESFNLQPWNEQQFDYPDGSMPAHNWNQSPVVQARRESTRRAPLGPF